MIDPTLKPWNADHPIPWLRPREFGFITPPPGKPTWRPELFEAASEASVTGAASASLCDRVAERLRKLFDWS